MGMNGTEVAKEAAEVVLADDNFATIARAVEEGRTVYDNIRKSILFILPTNGGEALTVTAAIALGVAMPLTPLQILWVNMITAVTLALALAFEPTERNAMHRPPRDPHEPLLNRFLAWRIVFVSLILVAGTLGVFLWEQSQGHDVNYARTIAVNTLVLFEIFYLFNTRYMNDPVLNRDGLLGNRYVLLTIGLVLVFQFIFTYAPPMQKLFATVPMDVSDGARATLVASSVLFAVEAEKWLVRRFATTGIKGQAAYRL
jgi:magnesium-transporting ATPase (P-type)